MEWLLICIVFLAILAVVLALPPVVKLVLKKRFLSAVAGDDTVYLTFDDGPVPESTTLVLKHLAAARVQATFFVVGQKVHKNPGLVADILEQGHEIGSHGYAHLHPWRVSPLAALRDLQAGYEELLKHCPVPPRFFRPPYGKFSLFSALWVLATGIRPAFWNVDPRDYAAVSAREVVDAILLEVRGGSVILLHDGYGREGRDPVLLADVLEELLPELNARGFRLSTLSGQ